MPCTQNSGNTTTSAPCFAACAVLAAMSRRFASIAGNGDDDPSKAWSSSLRMTVCVVAMRILELMAVVAGLFGSQRSAVMSTFNSLPPGVSERRSTSEPDAVPNPEQPLGKSGQLGHEHAQTMFETWRSTRRLNTGQTKPRLIHDCRDPTEAVPHGVSAISGISLHFTVSCATWSGPRHGTDPFDWFPHRASYAR